MTQALATTLCESFESCFVTNAQYAWLATSHDYGTSDLVQQANQATCSTVVLKTTTNTRVRFLTDFEKDAKKETSYGTLTPRP